jgi:GTP-binding protein Era
VAGYRAGFAALVGRPNVGKSTLLNAIIGRKLSIVTPKPQTTRHRIAGILTRPDYQIVFVDTPGLQDRHRRVLNQFMHRAAVSALEDADVLVLVVEALAFTAEDAFVLDRARRTGRPLIAAVNKVDRVRPRSRLLPYLEALAARAKFAAVVPLSALKRTQVASLPDEIARLLPESPALYGADQITDQSQNFRAAEIIREKLMLRLQEELPYGITVTIERCAEAGGLVEIDAVIWVERAGHKAMVIGAGGALLKAVGRSARLALNRELGIRAHLNLWVKVKERWADSEQALTQLGYRA